MSKYYEYFPDPVYELARKVGTESASQWLARTASSFSTAEKQLYFNEISARACHRRLGQPYFKIDPLFTLPLSRTSLCIPCECVAFPLPFFEIRFRDDDSNVPKNNGVSLRSLIVAVWPRSRDLQDVGITSHSLDALFRQKPTDCRNLTVLCDIGEQLNGHNVGEVYITYLMPGESVEASIDSIKRVNDIGGVTPTQEFLATVMRIVCAVALLATGNKELLSPDVLSRDEDRLAQCKTDADRLALHERAKKRGKYGWVIGREQYLPREYRPNDSESQSGRRLHFQHIRSGHFAAIRCGHNRESVKLVWRKITVVRSDLPLNPNARKGYKVG